jgi:hypothetical protein
MKAAANNAAAQCPETNLYDADFFGWTQRTAVRLRAGRFDAVDATHLAEEIEDMGKRDFIETKSRLRVLLTHLLKWRFQRAKRSRSWAATIFTQRHEIAALLDASPSLRPRVAAALADTYVAAVRLAALETGLPPRRFPPTCPFTIEELLDPDFLPN